MELKLKVLDGKHAGQEVAVPGSKFFIGRAEDCQLRPASDMISRHHCVLMAEAGYVGVRDLGSKNGTYVNAERVSGERELKAGDRLKVGPLEFEVVVRTGLGAKKKPAVTGGIKEAAARTAMGTATASDVDVNEWLTADAGHAVPKQPNLTPRVPNSADTEEIDMGSTKEVAIDDLLKTIVVPAEQPTQPVPDPKAKKEPGKLPVNALAATKPKDSRDAAMQVLEMMKKRR